MQKDYIYGMKNILNPNKDEQDHDAGQVQQLTDDSIQNNVRIAFLPSALELNFELQDSITETEF